MANYKNIEIWLPPIDENGNHRIPPVVDVAGTAEALLKATDWTQLPNSGLTDACVTLFATYRASIRTIRKTTPASPTWPTAPTEEWS